MGLNQDLLSICTDALEVGTSYELALNELRAENVLSEEMIKKIESLMRAWTWEDDNTYEKFENRFKLVIQGREMTKREHYDNGHLVSTFGWKMYNCECCDEEFAGPPETVGTDYICGICEMEIKAATRDSHGLEGMTYEGDEE